MKTKKRFLIFATVILFILSVMFVYAPCYCDPPACCKFQHVCWGQEENACGPGEYAGFYNCNSCGDDDDDNTPSVICGNGWVQSGEACDDGNSNNGDGCSYPSCQIESGWSCSGQPSICYTTCGDGIPAGIEECDEGTNNKDDQLPVWGQNKGDGDMTYCSLNCEVYTVLGTWCGDNIRQTTYEDCDDGNDIIEDCCSNLCKKVDAPPASMNVGVCENAVKVCDEDGDWEDPVFTDISFYQVYETRCDGLDNDCDGLDDVAEGLTDDYYQDWDEDGYGNLYSDSYPKCSQDVNSYDSTNNLDCNDTVKEIRPSAKENCGDGIDDDCSGTPDDNCPCLHNDKFCYDKPGVCTGYEETCGSDGIIPVCRWSSIENYEQNENSCDLLDNDCDGKVDEGCDDDKDSYVDSAMSCDSNFLNGNGDVKSCSEFKNDCDDKISKVYPGHDEICDGLDNDCNNLIDDFSEAESPYCHEVMSGYNNLGVCENQKATCNYKRFKAWYCTLSEFFSNEICNDELDNDCNGLIDDGCACESGKEQICGSNLGECKQGIQKCVNSQWSVCEDSINPVNEICDNLDNDCDDLIDDDVIKECTSDEGCPGLQKCYLGDWLDCEATCDNYIQIELDNDDFGKFVIDAKLNRNDVKDSLATLKVVNQTVSFSSSGDKISLKNSINPTNELKDFDYNLYIPKCLTPYLDEIKFENKDYTIIKEDPLIAWHFVNVDDRIDLNYEVKGEIDEACLEQIKGLPIAKVIGAELGKSEGATVRKNLVKFIIGIWIIFFAVGSVIYVSKRNPGKAKKSEDDYKNDFIEKEKKILLKKIKEMKFKSKEQARHHMENLGISDEIKDWILKKL